MPKLAEIIEMFEQFGFHEEHVRRALAQGKSAFNAFEGLKLTLQFRWGELCQELSVEQQKVLRPIYDRLQGITMKSRITQADKDHKERVRTAEVSDRMQDWLEGHQRRNVREVVGKTREILREEKRKGNLDAAGERRARAMGIFDEDEEI